MIVWRVKYSIRLSNPDLMALASMCKKINYVQNWFRWSSITFAEYPINSDSLDPFL